VYVSQPPVIYVHLRGPARVVTAGVRRTWYDHPADPNILSTLRIFCNYARDCTCHSNVWTELNSRCDAQAVDGWSVMATAFGRCNSYLSRIAASLNIIMDKLRQLIDYKATGELTHPGFYSTDAPISRSYPITSTPRRGCERAYCRGCRVNGASPHATVVFIGLPNL